VSTIEKAIEIAAKAHAGVKDKQGKPYLLHPIRVMMGVDGEAAQIVAVLHDVAEDTSVSMDDLRDEGFSPEVIEALGLVTHQKGQPYSEYVIACKQNEIARQVKLSDLRDNANLNRLLLRPGKFDGDSVRMQRYVLSYRFLGDEITENEYRECMQRLE
jgi:(p)ppGpp synthase/HD superfamily hydrolase